MHFREWLFCAAATIVGRLRAAGGGDPRKVRRWCVGAVWLPGKSTVRSQKPYYVGVDNGFS